MSELLKSRMVGLSDTKTTDEQIVTNWEQSGLLEGIGNEYTKVKTALLLEGVAKILLQSYNYYPTSGNFDTIIFPITRRVMSSIDNGDFKLVKDYDDVKEGLLELITPEMILERTSKMYMATIEFFNKIYDGEQNYDVEAEACAFMAEKVTQLYLGSFRNQNIIKGDNGWYTTMKI